MLVIIDANVMVSNVLKKNMEAMQGKHSVDILQNTAVLGASHIIRKVLQP
jgi:hypothetical protein